MTEEQIAENMRILATLDYDTLQAMIRMAKREQEWDLRITEAHQKAQAAKLAAEDATTSVKGIAEHVRGLEAPKRRGVLARIGLGRVKPMPQLPAQASEDVQSMADPDRFTAMGAVITPTAPASEERGKT